MNDNIFIFTGIGNYAAALTLLDGQKYIGQGASASIASITGLTLAADSDALPTTTPGANAVMIAGSGTSITLGVGNTIRGITVDNVGTGTKIFGSGFGTLTIGNNTTPDVTLSGTGKALDLTNGTFAATSAFSSVTTTSSPSHGMQLITVGGTVAFGSTSVSGSTAQGIFVNNSGVNLNFGNTTVGATGGATECIRLETNTGGTRTFGTIGVTNCTAQGITISGGGNVVATGQTTITNPGSTGLLLSSTTAGTSATFAGVNSTQSGGTGVQVSSSAGTVSFGDLDISPDSGQRALLADQNTGTISSTSGTIVATGNAGPFAISGPAGRTPLAMTLDSVNLTAPTNVGVNIALVSGNLTIGTTTIAGGAGNLVGLQVLSTAAGGTMNFGNTAVTGTNSVAGVRLGLAGQGNAGGVTFADLDIAPDSGHPALLITDGSGTTTSTSGAITATAAQAVNSSSSVLAMVLDSVTSTGGGITPGVNLTSSSGSIVMNGGTLTGNASGRTFLINSGTISSTYRGGITQAANSEMIEITGGHGTGTVTFNTGTLSATNGRGLLFDNADGLYNFNGITTLNGGDAGIDIINGSAGSLTFNGSTSITNPTGIAFRQDASNASVNYSGTITKTNNANHAVDINGKTGGATAFIGAITATTTTANAIDLTNTGGSTTFSGGMNINTTTGIGFNSTGAGQTVSVCDENP
ncbi:MAG: hypothetical protein IPK98_15935 [Chloracidobacterium sp.]|nr:hypothetical protein [Chloracidobacterium sp.]